MIYKYDITAHKANDDNESWFNTGHLIIKTQKILLKKALKYLK